MKPAGLIWWCWLLPLTLAAAPAPRTMIVGTKQAPPFVMKEPDGTWTGLSVDLWRDIALQLGLRYEFQEVKTPEELVDGVARGQFDAAVAAITVTPAREQRVDFSQPFFNSGLSIAIPRNLESGWRSTLATFFSWASPDWSGRWRWCCSARPLASGFSSGAGIPGSSAARRRPDSARRSGGRRSP